MNVSVGWGIVGVLWGGLLNGSFVVPIKRLGAWRWENTWLVYSAAGLIIFPWAMAWATVPRLNDVFYATSGATLAKVVVFGFGWGVGSVLFGLGLNRLGLAVGYGIIIGLIAPIGTFLPLFVLYPERLWTRQGLTLMIGTLLVLTGVVFCALAGRRRERESQSLAAMVQKEFWVGLIMCVLAGIFSPMLNFAFVFGAELQSKALASGSQPNMATNAIWALTLAAGFLANGGYCVYLLHKNRTWNLFFSSRATASYWAGGSLMGLVFFGSFMAYGMGATALGSLGGIVGWPLFMSMSLFASNLWGAVTGEWAGAGHRTYAYSLVGIAMIICAVVVISRGGSS